MCIYCQGVNNYFRFFSFYIFVTIHFTNVVLTESLVFNVVLVLYIDGMGISKK